MSYDPGVRGRNGDTIDRLLGGLLVYLAPTWWYLVLYRMGMNPNWH